MADKALLVGINEYKDVGDLRGCVNDVEDMKNLLVSTLGFDAGQIRTLLDEQATKKKMNQEMKWLLKDLKPGDRAVLHFSGHGSFTADEDGDEDDPADELLCLHDMDFEDPETFITDDDLRHWTKGLPKGARLVVVLDSCHSGSGTRLLLSPDSHKVKAVVVDDTAERAAHHGRGRDGGPQLAKSMLLLDEDRTVLARFVPPPPEIQARVKRRAKRRGLLRDIPQSQMNHTLLAACRDDQTAADAYIEDRFNGAFTHHLCKVIKASGTGVPLKKLHDELKKNLAAADFSQVPQLEGPDLSGTLFGEEVSPPDPHDGEQGESGSNGSSDASSGKPAPLLDILGSIVADGAGLSPRGRERALELLDRLTTGLAPGRPLRRSTATRYLVYVHGICRHTATFSNDWWDALHPFVTAFGAGNLGDTRHEVVWSDLVNERGLSRRARDVNHERAMEEVRETLEDRLQREAVEVAPTRVAGPRSVNTERALFGIPGLDCADDFMKYLLQSSLRSQILARFTEVVQPLLEDGAELDIISHSWGTVVAYEGLRRLDGIGSGRVRNFFTVGAALSIGPVKRRLLPANRDGAKPASVGRWVNLNARGDIVGGLLQGRPYAVDEDFPNLEPFGCERNFLGLVAPACAHGSYFKAGNDAVNRDLFGHFIDLP